MMIPVFRPDLNHLDIFEALNFSKGRSEFESALATRVEAHYAVAFAYGRSAIFATLKALGLSQAEVIIPAFTCQVVAEAVAASGNQPVFVDINLTDYNMDINAMKAALTSQTRAIIATHLYGYPTDVEAIRAMIGDNKILIIEDSAQLGPMGLQGDIGVYSFGQGKHLYTVQGGVVATNQPKLHEKIKLHRAHEMNHLPFSIWLKRSIQVLVDFLRLKEMKYELRLLTERLNLKEPLGSTKMSARKMPSDYAAAYTNLYARIGLAQLPKFDAIVTERRALAKFYDSELKNIPGITPAPSVTEATYALYTARLKQRDEIHFRQKMRAKGILIGLNYNYALPLEKPYRHYATGEYPCAEQAARETINLPIYTGLSINQVQHIVSSIRDACSSM